MKKFLFMVVAVVAMVATTQACNINRILNGNTAVSEQIKSFKSQGYEIQSDLTIYEVYNSPFLYASGSVTMTDANGAMVLIKFNVSKSLTNGTCTVLVTDVIQS